MADTEPRPNRGVATTSHARRGSSIGGYLSRSTRPWSRVVLVIGLIWVVFLLWRYYARAGDLLNWAELDWERDMFSLSFLRGLADFDPSSLAFWSFPAISDATTRAAVSITGAAMVLMAADGAGRLAPRLTSGIAGRGVRWCFRLSIGIAALSLAALALGSLGALTTTAIWMLVAPLAAYSALSILSSLKSMPRRPRVKPHSPWPVVIGLFLFIGLLLALAPEHEYDAIWYHLGLPRLWLETGELVTISGDSVTLYPMTWELIFSLGMGVGGAGAAKLLHFATLPLTGLVVAALARRVTPRVPRWLPVAIFVSIPTVLWEATTAYVDLALTFHISLLLYAVIRYVDTRRDLWIWLGAVNLGLALATKHLALLAAVLVVPGLMVAIRRADGSWVSSIRPVLILSTALALAAPWYLRAFVQTGNPVFPEMFEIFGAPPEWWDATTEAGLDAFKARFGRPRTPWNLLSLPWDVTVHGARYGGSLGPILLLLLPFSLFGRLTPAARWLGLFAAGFVALWASPIGSFQLRFLLPVVPVLALLAGEGATAVKDRIDDSGSPGGARVARGALVALMVLNLPFFMSLHETDRVVWEGWLTHVAHEVHLGVILGQESEDEFLRRRLPSYRAREHANANLPDDARVLNFMGEDRLYATVDWVAAHATQAREAVRGSETLEPIEAFDSLGFTHILVDVPLIEDGGQGTPILDPQLLEASFETEYEDPRALMLRRTQR